MKGQIVSADLSISVLVFISFFAASALIFQFMLSESYEIDRIDEMSMLSSSVSDILLRTPGIPENWNSSCVTLIGLSGQEGIIDYGRLNELSLMEYSAATEAMGIEGFDFAIGIENSTSEIFFYGIYPPEGSFISPSTRYCLLDENGKRTPIVFSFILWSEIR